MLQHHIGIYLHIPISIFPRDILAFLPHIVRANAHRTVAEVTVLPLRVGRSLVRKKSGVFEEIQQHIPQHPNLLTKRGYRVGYTLFPEALYPYHILADWGRPVLVSIRLIFNFALIPNLNGTN